jgi:hypothetical protein
LMGLFFTRSTIWSRVVIMEGSLRFGSI